jgi:hypothetical protein
VRQKAGDPPAHRQGGSRQRGSSQEDLRDRQGRGRRAGERAVPLGPRGALAEAGQDRRGRGDAPRPHAPRARRHGVSRPARADRALPAAGFAAAGRARSRRHQLPGPASRFAGACGCRRSDAHVGAARVAGALRGLQCERVRVRAARRRAFGQSAHARSAAAGDRAASRGRDGFPDGHVARNQGSGTAATPGAAAPDAARLPRQDASARSAFAGAPSPSLRQTWMDYDASSNRRRPPGSTPPGPSSRPRWTPMPSTSTSLTSPIQARDAEEVERRAGDQESLPAAAQPAPQCAPSRP